MERLEIFQEYRLLLFGLAYRMLGSVTEAEDMMQEAWIRWQAASTVAKTPKTFLYTLVTRLCIDRLRYLRREREKYIGLWLPEPLVNPGYRLEITESISYAFLVLLECLSPTERAVFLLREVFDYDYSQISVIVNKSIPNCRQIFHRSRKSILANQSQFNLSHNEQNLLIEQFLAAWNQGDLDRLLNLMAEDAVFHADGGGKVTASEKPLYGQMKIARFLLAVKRSKLIPDFNSQAVLVNNKIGVINIMGDRTQSIFSFQFTEHKIKTIFAVVNPDKLTAVCKPVKHSDKSQS